jgi:ABC-type Mn2+/Zn2+ transport system ATPase subunit
MQDNDDYILKVSDLNVRLQNQTILEDVSFKLKRGTALAVLGPNGAGKTVMVVVSGLIVFLATVLVKWKTK